MRCSFGRVSASERGSSGRIGKSAKSRHPVHSRFPLVALPSEWASVVCRGALHNEALEGWNREGHEGLVGSRILGERLKKAQEVKVVQ